MRKSSIAFVFACLLMWTPFAGAQTDPLGKIRTELAAKYSPTTTTADKTAIVTAGSILVLKKSNLLTAPVTSMLVVTNTYRGGRITQGLVGQLANGSKETRTFLAGEKVWVTDIEVKSKGIVFSLFSNSYSGERYRATLKFPFTKGSELSAPEAIAIVSEVFDTERPITETGGEHKQTAEQQTAPNQENAGVPALSTPPLDNTPWDSRHGRLTRDELARMNQPNLGFQLNYFRLNPGALDEKGAMQYFIALNNCNDKDIERALNNELDYPALAAFYKSKAPQIFASLPKTVNNLAVDRYIGAKSSPDGWVMWAKYLTLGDYNPQQKAFPLDYPGKKGVEIPDTLTVSNGVDLRKACPVAADILSISRPALPSAYDISIQPAYYSELPMDEGSARKYIDATGRQRNVFLALDATILDSRPEISRSNTGIDRVTFRAQTARIRVIDERTGKPLGILFDDGTLPAEVQSAQAPPPPAAQKPANQWAFGDHMYEIRTAVYVSLAADACGWPLTAGQNANLSRFLGQMSTRGSFNEKYQYNLADNNIKNAISAKGRQNFCANPVERRSFDKLSASIAPRGPLAALSSK